MDYARCLGGLLEERAFEWSLETQICGYHEKWGIVSCLVQCPSILLSPLPSKHRGFKNPQAMVWGGREWALCIMILPCKKSCVPSTDAWKQQDFWSWRAHVGLGTYGLDDYQGDLVAMTTGAYECLGSLWREQTPGSLWATKMTMAELCLSPEVWSLRIRIKLTLSKQRNDFLQNYTKKKKNPNQIYFLKKKERALHKFWSREAT